MYEQKFALSLVDFVYMRHFDNDFYFFQIQLNSL